MSWVLVAVLLLQPLPAAGLSDAQALVVEAWRLVSQGYVDPDRLEAVRWRRLRQKALERSIVTSSDAYEAIEFMLMPLGDPYTRLLRPADYAALRSSTQGNLSGVGLQLGVRGEQGSVVVIAPLEGSPAAEAGIESGTELIAVDGASVSVLGLETTAARLRGEAGTQVILQLRDPGAAPGETTEVTLERRQVDLRPVRSRRVRLDGHTFGYVRLTQFSEGVPDQLIQALADLSGKGIEGLILDLRNNSGGLVEAGLAVADAFLVGVPIVETRNREGIDELLSAHAEQAYDGPMVTLVNGGTASASEILAGALQDADRSPLMGRTSFGKGLIQSLIPLSDGSGLAITVARYLTPAGRDIQITGIVPDEVLEDEEVLVPGSEEDRWLRAAERMLVRRLESGTSEPDSGPALATDEADRTDAQP
ncbi:carboxyl-terminal processing protease CtpZ [Synechococcus sp. RSCCF101]|uniref:carboxyl-terminal processing protease CtpZ n=1 Tax=Synechococcus sp. RSCCF101 TaxID=2511069 RepID=UPI001CD99DB0|nr:carboxyl-terminal processing protease CtpZ [Synechococcus sp. RSCCF101]